MVLPMIKNKEDFMYSHLCFDGALENMLHTVEQGTNILISNPESVAHKIEISSVNKNESGIQYSGPLSFPFDSVCLWHTPLMFDPSDPKNPKKSQHLIHAQKINNKAVYFDYAYCEENFKVDRVGGEMDFSWVLIPYGILFILPPYSLCETPILPLPKNLENHVRLRQSIINVKTGKEPDASMALVSLLKDKNSSHKNEAMEILIPGVFEIFFGFLEHMVKGDLSQSPKVEEKLVIPDPKHVSDMVFSEVQYQNVAIKK
jgi:hypothetical protein